MDKSFGAYDACLKHMGPLLSGTDKTRMSVLEIKLAEAQPFSTHESEACELH